MNLSHTLGGCANIVHGKEFPMNSVILKLDNGIELVCASFQQSRKEPIIIFVYLPDEKKWKKGCTKNAYTEMMWDYYKKIKPKKKSCYKKKNLKKNRKKGTKPVNIPSSVKWSMKHPFQGGGVSPR